MSLMVKSVKTSSSHDKEGGGAASIVVRDAKTGKFVEVRGIGALKGSGLKIRNDVNLVKPIAEQVLSERFRQPKGG
ncbi:hypothetical protein [Jiella avicenniae]|uniref:Uncharacterized protein n=1 Tax=Jiella avicenniae TaxID=2907202 RepID=A0A9X1NZT4_9HYPH|nr:hypothetical protein [Jiella avicenniae]MCE7027893.1 hypothetical protein [Jiella avicenniae]